MGTLLVFGGEGMQPDTKTCPYGRVFVSGWREASRCRMGRGGTAGEGREGVSMRIYSFNKKKKNLSWGWAQRPIPTLVSVPLALFSPSSLPPSCRCVLGSSGPGWRVRGPPLRRILMSWMDVVEKRRTPGSWGHMDAWRESRDWFRHKITELHQYTINISNLYTFWNPLFMSTGFPKNLTFSSSNSLIYPKNKIKIVIYLFKSNFKNIINCYLSSPQ